MRPRFARLAGLVASLCSRLRRSTKVRKPPLSVIVHKSQLFTNGKANCQFNKINYGRNSMFSSIYVVSGAANLRDRPDGTEGGGGKARGRAAKRRPGDARRDAARARGGPGKGGEETSRRTVRIAPRPRPPHARGPKRRPRCREGRAEAVRRPDCNCVAERSPAERDREAGSRGAKPFPSVGGTASARRVRDGIAMTTRPTRGSAREAEEARETARTRCARAAPRSGTASREPAPHAPRRTVRGRPAGGGGASGPSGRRRRPR